VDGRRDGVVGDLSRVPISKDLDGGGLEVGNTSLNDAKEKTRKRSALKRATSRRAREERTNLSKSTSNESDRNEKLSDVLERRNSVKLLEFRVVDFGRDDLD